ncbi:hypothetical protein CCMSSC00406_0005268 [Pleurotus cornucopiae]|uniref:Uncharacterized protein n=1 Tax=Pleurotus cornucopiae TaxID=5321 RepID=A0ACB7II29_PLECO|nr:hypothetical protein CCMSSC00406_0005268 [Pleurotus cornucopiae]
MPPIPLQNSHFTLDVSGIAGFLGASQAISGMESVHFYKYRRFLGFHNTPGSYNTAQHYGRLARGAVWDGLFPGNNDEPAIFLRLDGERGPKYRSIASGTEIINIGHVGHILAQYCRGHYVRPTQGWWSEDKNIRITKAIDVTIVGLHGDGATMEASLANGRNHVANRPKLESEEGTMNRETQSEGDTVSKGGAASDRQSESANGKGTSIVVSDVTNGTNTKGPDAMDAHAQQQNTSETRVQHPANIRSSPWTHALALFASLFSIAGCVVCGVYREWFAFALILLGILCNGIACLLIGRAQISFQHPEPSPHSPPGDGLLDDGDQFIVLKGCEKAVNYVVKGRIIVKYGESRAFHRIGVSAVLLTIQFIGQLFIIPRSRLFGQIIFLSTLAVSWLSNCSLSSINKEELQMMVILNTLPFSKPAPKREDNTLDLRKQRLNFTKFTMPTRTSAVVFATLCALPLNYLKNLNYQQRIKHIRGVLGSSLPKNTPAWDEWMDLVPERVGELLWVSEHPDSELLSQLPRGSKITEIGDKKLLEDLLQDAKNAFDCFTSTHEWNETTGL